ncbi:hypothetical protein GPECTOR_4g593 [Gonium pectorale]|uniref:Uncharacterized protein n=1 Tax=Gonium pectorale TaxID=33097 RepID=A0A150GXW4_GONPE|nr:hypothetical protein GPECTOR_4g593 [Gonium pectorale]|eukprot:KXZ54528.1 hypothetical protein GPECTOR_4g593 [Gonium pectorale]
MPEEDGTCCFCFPWRRRSVRPGSARPGSARPRSVTRPVSARAGSARPVSALRAKKSNSVAAAAPEPSPWKFQKSSESFSADSGSPRGSSLALQDLHRVRRASATGPLGGGSGAPGAAAGLAPAPPSPPALAPTGRVESHVHWDRDGDSFSSPAHQRQSNPLASAGGSHVPSRLAPLPPLRVSHGGNGILGGGGGGYGGAHRLLPLADSPLHSRHGSITSALPGSLPSMSHPAMMRRGGGTAQYDKYGAHPDQEELPSPNTPGYGMGAERPSRFGQESQDQVHQIRQRGSWAEEEEQPYPGQYGNARAEYEEATTVYPGETQTAGDDDGGHSGSGGGACTYSVASEWRHSPSRLSGAGRGEFGHTGKNGGAHYQLHHAAHGAAGYSPSVEAGGLAAARGPAGRQVSGQVGRGWGVTFTEDIRGAPEPQSPQQPRGLNRMGSSGVNRSGLGGMAAPRPALAADPTAFGAHAAAGPKPFPLHAVAPTFRGHRAVSPGADSDYAGSGGGGGSLGPDGSGRPSPGSEQLRQLQAQQAELHAQIQRSLGGEPPPQPAAAAARYAGGDVYAYRDAPLSPPPVQPPPSGDPGPGPGPSLVHAFAAVQALSGEASFGEAPPPPRSAPSPSQPSAAPLGRDPWAPSPPPPLQAAASQPLMPAPSQLTPGSVAEQRKAAASANEALLASLLSGGGRGGALDFASTKVGGSTAEELERFDRVGDAVSRLDEIMAAGPRPITPRQ